MSHLLKGIIMKYKGSCQCGQIAFEVEGELKDLLACNCSMCARRASLLWFVGRDQLHLQTTEEKIATYMFNKHQIKHRFCPTCGIHTFGEGTDPKGNKTAAINARCLEDVDLSKLPVAHWDGKSM